jgi:Skp family chaperone for outer membrane proteins
MKVVISGVWGGLGLAALLGAGTPAEGQQPAVAPARIGFVNAQLVLRSLPGYAKAESTYTKELEASRTEMARLQAQMDSAVAEFEQQQPMLSTSNRAARRKELETRNQQLQARGQDVSQRLSQRERELLAPMQERVTAVIEGIRAEGNYSLIVDPSAPGVVAYDKSLDLTQRVVQRLRQAN